MGMGAVPLACMDELMHQGNTWRFVFDSLPPLYAQSIQALSESGGIAWEPAAKPCLRRLCGMAALPAKRSILPGKAGRCTSQRR